MNSLPPYKPMRMHILLAQVACVLLMLVTSLAFMALYVSPQTTVLFQWIGVSLPFLLFGNLIFLFIALYRRSWYSICPMIAILANFHYFSQMVRQHTGEEVHMVDIRFATFNVREFKMIYNMSSMEQIAEYLSSNKINTICLQEVPAECSVADLKRVFTSMPYVVITGGRPGQNQLAILSAYPLDHVTTVSFEERPNCSLFADMTIKNEKVRIANCHLQTTNWNQVKGTIFQQEHDKGSWIEAFAKMSSNFRYRSRQVDTIRSIIDRSPHPIIVGGDFNNSPVSYAYNTIKGDLKDAFREVGNGYGYTYRNLLKLYRIDFVLFSGTKLQVSNYRTGDVDFSDHLPVLVDVTIN
ncbi:endonuclease/exonuclease/phosphatase family protein [Sphingobacterium faecium]|uniref:endonuclease/exonuclease/phosphatase family protein n=1 Tax=Sphingobacterium faecium TaxID=34087 RepID=UPI0032092E45